MREFLEQSFTVTEIGTGTMTGYYEPTLRGELAVSEVFATPLLAVPPRDWARRGPAATAQPEAARAVTEGQPQLAAAEASPELLEVHAPSPLAPGAAHATPPLPFASVDPTGTEQTELPAMHPAPPVATEQATALPGAPTPSRRAARSMPAVVPRGPPFPPRSEIEDGALAGRGLELAWVDSAVDAFFLHIQGSGRVVLPDGRLLRIGYAAQNGHPYRGIGRVLIERGEIRRNEMSMHAIRAWLAAAPLEVARDLMRLNASYIFFRLVEGLRPEDGPIGAMGVSLTPLRSVAIDPAFVPMGAPLFLAGAAPLPRLVVAQDTGGAIRGPGRVDLFWGWDAASGLHAGGTYQPARMFLLRPRPGEPPAR